MSVVLSCMRCLCCQKREWRSATWISRFVQRLASDDSFSAVPGFILVYVSFDRVGFDSRAENLDTSRSYGVRAYPIKYSDRAGNSQLTYCVLFSAVATFAHVQIKIIPGLLDYRFMSKNHIPSRSFVRATQAGICPICPTILPPTTTVFPR